MHFRTICITKVRLKATLFLMLNILIICVFALVNAEPQAIPAFNSEDEYIEILNKSLPLENSFDIKEKLMNIMGFKPDKPETVIAEFSPIFAEAVSTPLPTEIPITPEPVNVMSEPTSEPTPEPQKINFPSKSEIMTGVGLEVNNASSYTVNLKELCQMEMPFKIEKNSEPQILIVHTHTTECFNGDAMNGETERTADNEKNMISVGNVIAEVFENNGIHCVHDETVHDYPSYQGAYTRTLSTIKYNLEKYPSIKAVIDVHRDAYIYPDGSKLTVKYEQNGVSTAKVMLVVGTDGLGLSHPEWKGNLSFAAKIQSAANIMYPGIMRPINLRRERFNMHMTSGSILVEVGSNGNTLEEAKQGGKNIAQAISAVLLAE